MSAPHRIPTDSDREGELELSGSDLDECPEWQLALRIAGSKSFRKSAFLPRFLLYVCRLQLSGREHLISETRIGVEVFHRPENYNPAEDNVVRNYARILRKRIEDYFQLEGAAEPFRLTIPRGGYIPFFEILQPQKVESDAGDSCDTDPQETAKATDREVAEPPPAALPYIGTSVRLLTRLRLPLAFLAGAFFCLAAFLIFAPNGFQGLSAAPGRTPPAAALLVWREMFQQDRNTLIVPADSGIGVLENLTHRPMTLAHYLAGAPVTAGRDDGSLNDLQSQHYTSLVSLDIILGLSRMRLYQPDRCFVRYPRFLSLKDFREFNVILLGSVHSDPWVSLFENQLNFRPTFGSSVNESYIANERPAAGEEAVYRNLAGTSHHLTYSVIDYLPNLNASGHVLLIQGLSMAGPQAAANILMQDSDLDHWIKRALMPDGSLRPFEILVRCDTLEADAPHGEIVAMRVHS